MADDSKRTSGIAPEGCDPFHINEASRVVIDNGRGYYNMPLHCPGSKTTILGGSMPGVLFFGANVHNPKSIKFGEISLGIQDADGKYQSFAEAFDVRTEYFPGKVTWTLRGNPSCTSVEVVLVPLVTAEGLLLRASVCEPQPGSMLCIHFGHLDYEGSYYCPWDPGQQGPLKPAATERRTIKATSGENSVVLTCEDLPGIVSACAFTAAKGEARCEDGAAKIPLAAGAVCWAAAGWGRDDSILDRLHAILERPDRELTASVEYSRRVSCSIDIGTPHDEIDLYMKFVNYAADACWRPPAFLHSSSTWDWWFVGWRNYYGPTVAGWHKRVESALSFHSRYTTRPDQYPRNGHLAEMENTYIDSGKKAAGRIHMCVSPSNPNECGGHHDCDQLFIDFAYHHLCWTGDVEFIGTLWNTLEAAIAYQKAARDPDEDGLYTNVLNTWLSDSHEYHQGACTVQSAYLCRNNLQMAEMAKCLGKDPSPFDTEAQRIKSAMFEHLWMESEGIFAEYRDIAGILHPEPESTSIYHPIELGVVDKPRGRRMLKWMCEHLLRKDGLVNASNWLPTGRCLHATPITCETLNMAFAAYCVDLHELAFKMLGACCRTYGNEEVIFSKSFIPMNPQCDSGNIDMLDTASLFQRTIVEGLYGIRPQLQNGLIQITPSFPEEWSQAKIVLSDIGYSYQKHIDRIVLKVQTSIRATLVLKIKLHDVKAVSAEVNGEPTEYQTMDDDGVRYAVVTIKGGSEHSTLQFNTETDRSSAKKIELPVGRAPAPVAGMPQIISLPDKSHDRWIPLSLEDACNGSETQLFGLIPGEVKYGMSVKAEECLPDNGWVNGFVKEGILHTAIGVPFKYSVSGDNRLILTSPKIDNIFQQGYLKKHFDYAEFFRFPNSVELPIKRLDIDLVMIMFEGITSPMQSFVDAVEIAVNYESGEPEKMVLKNPANFDFFMEHSDSNYCQPLSPIIHPWKYKLFKRQRHADILPIPVDSSRELTNIRFRVKALDTAICIAGITMHERHKGI